MAGCGELVGVGCGVLYVQHARKMSDSFVFDGGPTIPTPIDSHNPRVNREVSWLRQM